MIERKMDNRGSKSKALLVTIKYQKNAIVKEQRVNGSWYGVYTPMFKLYSSEFRKKPSD